MVTHILCVFKKAILAFIFNLANQRGDHHVIRRVSLLEYFEHSYSSGGI